MAWIRTVDPADAEGDLKRLYDAATKRGGHVWNIVSVMSPNPPALRASMAFYAALMLGDSPLTRAQREMLAVVVSAVNECHY